jgi:hypothetical protein
MGWTSWRKLAERSDWYDEFDWDGPACYELALAGPRGGDLRIVYVGETSNEHARMATYGRDGSHLAEIIQQHLRAGWCIWYRAESKKSKREAVAMQNRMLARFMYDWNVQLNSSD